MPDKKVSDQTSPLSRETIGTALLFGLVALLIVLARLTIPIPGTEAVTDPRELFTTIGASLSGPVAAVLIGILAGVGVSGVALASMFAHVTGCVWVGFAYKKLLHGRPGELLGWSGLIFVYYYLCLIPAFLVGTALFHGEKISFEAYLDLAKGALPEAALTALVTTLAMYALPRKYKRPLW